jgi:uncharacterized protein
VFSSRHARNQKYFKEQEHLQKDQGEVWRTMSNQELIDRFFEAYLKRDFEGVKNVMADDVTWTFPGHHPFAGVKTGIDEVIAFFDTMGGIMNKSNPTIEKLIVAGNEHYVVECSHIITNRAGGPNIDHHVCVLWTVKDGKIVAGRHFFADPESADTYFNAVSAQGTGT